jgi:hypothetical protein
LEKHGYLVLSDEKDIAALIPKEVVTIRQGNFVVGGEGERNCVWVDAEHCEVEVIDLAGVKGR